MTNFLELHKDYLDNALGYYYENSVFLKYYNRIPKSRYHTFKYCYDYLKDSKPIIVELGTSRSFVDGRFEGACSDNIKYWNKNNPDKWDWSAGYFTKIFANLFSDSTIHTVDIDSKHLSIAKLMNSDKNNILYHHTTSEHFLNTFNQKIDLLYLDTGNMDEETAKLHKREIDIIIKKNLLSDNGLILIDDVKNPWMLINTDETSVLGKSKYSVPLLLNNGYKLIMDEYQMILKKE